jgi:hypothetical protein
VPALQISVLDALAERAAANLAVPR